jgi:hypothetical protein
MAIVSGIQKPGVTGHGIIKPKNSLLLYLSWDYNFNKYNLYGMTTPDDCPDNNVRWLRQITGHCSTVPGVSELLRSTWWDKLTQEVTALLYLVLASSSGPHGGTSWPNRSLPGTLSRPAASTNQTKLYNYVADMILTLIFTARGPKEPFYFERN